MFSDLSLECLWRAYFEKACEVVAGEDRTALCSCLRDSGVGGQAHLALCGPSCRTRYFGAIRTMGRLCRSSRVAGPLHLVPRSMCEVSSRSRPKYPPCTWPRPSRVGSNPPPTEAGRPLRVHPRHGQLEWLFAHVPPVQRSGIGGVGRPTVGQGGHGCAGSRVAGREAARQTGRQAGKHEGKAGGNVEKGGRRVGRQADSGTGSRHGEQRAGR